MLLGNSTLIMVCVPDEEGHPATDRLLHTQQGMHRSTWPDYPTIEFHLWATVTGPRRLQANVFDVEALLEL